MAKLRITTTSARKSAASRRNMVKAHVVKNAQKGRMSYNKGR